MRSLWNLYQEYVVDLDPILWEMGRVNGIHVDNTRRLELVAEMDKRIEAAATAAQPFVPEKLFPLKHLANYPKEFDREGLPNYDFSRPIREVKVPNDKVKTCSRCGTQHVTKSEHTSRKGGRNGSPENACYKADIILTPGIDTEYDVVLPFNPGSDDQLKAYAELFKHRLGRNWKTGNDTLDAKQVQKFINKYGVDHPIYSYALEIRKIRKARGYANAWVPNEHGLVFGKYVHTPETFRLAQKEHNFTNVSHRGDAPYAEELRSLLVAPPGYLLVEADSSSIEAVFSGHLMGSEEYKALATRGIHAWWAAKTLGLEPTAANLKFVKNAKEHAILYETKKRTVHGTNYGMGAGLLYSSYPHIFKNKAAAQAEIDEYYSLVPELQAWHKEIQEKAHKQGYLQNRWGFRNYYYRVFFYDWKKKVYRPGEDAKAAIAFEPQSSNAFFQRENIKLIYNDIKKMGKADKWKFTAIGHVHDSNGLRVPEDDRDKAGQLMAEHMNRPIKQMDNIQIGVQVKAGKRWSEMEAFLTV